MFEPARKQIQAASNSNSQSLRRHDKIAERYRTSSGEAASAGPPPHAKMTTEKTQPDGCRHSTLINRLATHPLRNLLHEEVHARPPPLVNSPISASHLVFLADEP